MATDVLSLKLANEQLAEAVANLQRAIDQMQQQHALLTEALVRAARGQWDSARFGCDSVEAILVALNPALQGKLHAAPFEVGQ
jgi:hypothetical protein